MRRIDVAILRLIAPICEGERMAYRKALHMAQAQAEDITISLRRLGR